MVLTWMEGLNRKIKFSVYCSDVSGAFDRVNRQRLIDKLRAKGVRDDIVRVFAAWLDERQALVVVGCKQAESFTLQNMIYQGTVWGPWLWNLFYEDAKTALHKHQYQETVFAHDLNAFRGFGFDIPNSALATEAKRCQQELHNWGRANQVEFDLGKNPSMWFLIILPKDWISKFLKFSLIAS